MSEKVKLPRGVAGAIETIRKSNMSEHGLYDIDWLESDIDDNDQIRIAKDSICIYIESSTDQFDPKHPLINYYKALVNGYEVEETPEEKVRYWYENPDIHNYNPNSWKMGIKVTLDALGIKIEGVNT